MVKITEKHDRSVLSEGRSSGMGFAMLKKIDDNNYETVNPISPCKDYLAEVVFTENTGLPTKAYGLVYNKKLDILSEKMSYLVFKNQKTKIGTFNLESKTFEAYGKEIKDNYKNIENFINNFQKKFRGFLPCIIEEAEDDHFLVTFDTRWTKSSYSISLFTLLLRIAKDYRKSSVVMFLLSINKNSMDYSLVNSAFKKIINIIEYKKLPGIPNNFIKARIASNAWSPHGYGICMWDEKYA